MFTHSIAAEPHDVRCCCKYNSGAPIVIARFCIRQVVGDKHLAVAHAERCETIAGLPCAEEEAVGKFVVVEVFDVRIGPEADFVPFDLFECDRETADVIRSELEDGQVNCLESAFVAQNNVSPVGNGHDRTGNRLPRACFC